MVDNPTASTEKAVVRTVFEVLGKGLVAIIFPALLGGCSWMIVSVIHMKNELVRIEGDLKVERNHGVYLEQRLSVVENLLRQRR